MLLWLCAYVGKYSFLHQLHSWSAFQCTEDIFRKILTAYCVHPSFLDFIHSFGTKHDEKDEDLFGGYACYMQRTPAVDNSESQRSLGACSLDIDEYEAKNVKKFATMFSMLSNLADLPFRGLSGE